MRVAIIGAGMAGIACAEWLRAAGTASVLFDKGRGPGGRMSTRRTDTPFGPASFDHGAQYFTVRDPGFRARVGRWATATLAAPWPAAGPDAWVGSPGMNAPLKEAASGLDVRQSTLVEVPERDGAGWRVAGERFDALVVATPAENAAPLLDALDPPAATLARATGADPCWTVMAAFGERVDAPDVLRGNGAVGWAARNSAKPGRGGPEAWVVQAGPDWSRAHLEETPEAVAAALLPAFAAEFGLQLPPGPAVAAHRWRYARSGNAGIGHLWRPDAALGVCGDWLLGPRVEAAWLSGDGLAQAMQSGAMQSGAMQPGTVQPRAVPA